MKPKKKREVIEMSFPRGNIYATATDKLVTRGDLQVIARANTWTVQNPEGKLKV